MAGETALHNPLIVEPDRIEAELQRLAPDGVSLHALRLRTTPPRGAGRSAGAALAEDAVASLLASFDDALDDPDFARELGAELAAAIGKLPPALQEDAEVAAMARPDGLRRLAAEARAVIGHRLGTP